MSRQPDPTRRTGLFGGSFDPLHIGHLNLVRQLHLHGHLEQTLFIPAAVPPHKRDRRVTPGDVRLAMLEAALEDEADCYVSDYELEAGGVSYTVDTVKHFAGVFDELRLVIGMDSLRDLHTWYKVDELLDTCQALIYARPGYAAPDPDELIARFGEEHGNMLANSIVETETIAVSSTEIREAIQQGNAPIALLPPPVWGYIQANSVYNQPL